MLYLFQNLEYEILSKSQGLAQFREDLYIFKKNYTLNFSIIFMRPNSIYNIFRSYFIG